MFCVCVCLFFLWHLFFCRWNLPYGFISFFLSALLKYNWHVTKCMFKVCNLMSFVICIYTNETTTIVKIMNISINLQGFSVPLGNPFLQLPHPQPGKQWYAFCHYRLNCIFIILYKWNHTLYTPLPSDFFHWTWLFWFSYMLLYLSVIYSCLLLGSIPLFEYILICLCSHLFLDIWILFSFLTIRNKAAYKRMYTRFHVDICSRFS